MSGPRLDILRHPDLGIAMPWWDARPVPRSCLLEYLGSGDDGLQTLIDAGCFAHPGCCVVRGQRRPTVSYIPAVIWARNGWVPDAHVLSVLAASSTALARTIATVRALIDHLDGRIQHRPPPPIAFPPATAIAAT